MHDLFLCGISSHWVCFSKIIALELFQNKIHFLGLIFKNIYSSYSSIHRFSYSSWFMKSNPRTWQQISAVNVMKKNLVSKAFNKTVREFIARSRICQTYYEQNYTNYKFHHLYFVFYAQLIVWMKSSILFDCFFSEWSIFYTQNNNLIDFEQFRNLRTIFLNIRC